MSDLAWHKAAGVLRLAADKRAAGWPDAFGVGELASLQYPAEGSAEQKVSARKKRAAFEAAINEAITAGTIQPEYKTVTVPRQEQRGWRDPYGDEWLGRHAPKRPLYVTVLHEVPVTLIPRAAFARWWGEQREAASEHLAAWLALGTQDGEERARNSRILAAVEAGKSQGAVAKEFGISRGRVGQIVRAEKAKGVAASFPTATKSNTWALLPGGKDSTAKRPPATRKTAKC